MGTKKMEQVIREFRFEGTPKAHEPYGSGHINDTFRITCELADGSDYHYILQRMNRDVFKHPLELMENIMGVTRWLKMKIIEQGGDPHRETLNVVQTNEGANCYRDTGGEYWRAYEFIEHATSYDQVACPQDFYESAVAFGNFQRMLADYPASTLYETIPDFHNTKDRYDKFCRAVSEDTYHRAEEVAREIAFVQKHRDLSCILTDLLEAGRLPLRVTHNDTKLNNIMIDDQTHRGICIIDLDTVMPGLALHDFGDSIRFGASTAAEDERDLEKVMCSLDLFALYTKGFIEGCAGSLTDLEVSLLPTGALVMTYECGMRFLTDYLSGDTYFKTHRLGQNIDRARTQFKLVQDMLDKREAMEKIVREL